MHPVLLEFGGITLYTYGLFVALGFLSAIWFAGRRARAAGSGITPQEITDLFFVVLISSLVGARLFFVLQNLPLFAESPLDVFKIWKGGLVFYGGFIAAVAGAMGYVRIKGLDLWNTADIMAPAIALGHAVGRMGCFFAGCCHGKTCDLPWAVTFSDPHSLAPLGVPLHPTQLYSVGTNLLIFFLLLLLSRKPAFPGRIFWTYILLYGFFRSLVEVFRGDARGAFFLGMFSPSQVVGLVLCAVALVMLRRLSRSRPSAPSRKER